MYHNGVVVNLLQMVHLHKLLIATQRAGLLRLPPFACMIKMHWDQAVIPVQVRMVMLVSRMKSSTIKPEMKLVA